MTACVSGSAGFAAEFGRPCQKTSGLANLLQDRYVCRKSELGKRGLASRVASFKLFFDCQTGRFLPPGVGIPAYPFTTVPPFTWITWPET